MARVLSRTLSPEDPYANMPDMVPLNTQSETVVPWDVSSSTPLVELKVQLSTVVSKAT